MSKTKYANRANSHSKLIGCAHAAAPLLCEALERRVLLTNTPVPITTPLNTGTGALQSVVQDVSGKLADLQTEVKSIHDQLASSFGDLPLVGTALKDAVNGGTDAFNGVAAGLKSAIATLSGAATITGTDLQGAIYTALGPSGLGVLPASVHSASDVPIQLYDTDGNTANAEQVDFNLEFAGTLFTAALHPNFNLGLPGLGLKVNGTVQAQVTYDVKLNVVVDATDGFYLDLSGGPEISLALNVSTPGLSAQGNLGFLQLNATDGTPSPSPTQFTQLMGTISADLSVPGDKLEAGNIGSLLDNSTLSANAEADVHLHAILSFGGSANFPSLDADLDLTWKLGNASLSGGGVTDSSFGSEPDIEFNNVQIDLGSFFSKFVTPVVNEIKTVLQPIQPLIDLLNTRMPVFSDIGFLENKFDTNHDGKVSLLEVIEALTGGNDSTKFLDTVVAIDNFVDSIPTLGSGDMINLGSFDLGGASNANNTDVRGLADLTSVNLTSFSAANIATELTNLGTSIGGTVGGQVAGFLGTIAGGALGGGTGDDASELDFPILDNPASAFKLLLGQNVDLFTFSTPTLDLSAQLDEFFSILGPLGIELKGTVDSNNTFIQAKAHLSMGYDTQGLKEFAVTDNFNPSDITDLFDGFYVVDDPMKTFASLNVGVGAFAAINVVVASAGVGGGINGNITFTVNDPDNDGLGVDGKLRPKEIASDLEMSPLCLFDIMGSLTASLSAFIRVGFDTPFGFVGWSDNFTLASSTLADFSFGCSTMPPSPPVLATVLGDGTLRLNMGPYAADRVNGDVSDDDESFTVSHVSTAGDGTETVEVSAFGYQQQYSGVTKIYGEGGNGNDSIVLDAGVVSPAQLWGDFNPGNPDNGGATASGNDTLTAADGPATLHGGAGDDQLSAGSGPATMYGEDGNDLMIGGPSGDYMDGGNGNNTMYGMGGNDSMFAGSGDDYMDGGDGNDSIDGGDGNDHLIGGTGDDTLTGDGGNDILEGNAGNDSLDGGSGNDLLLGDDSTIAVVNNAYVVSILPGGGNDTLLGGDGNDSLYGEGGNDSISGGTGDDYMQGNAGDDTMDGGDGNDTMIGGQGNDSMTGDAGNDIMLGDDGDVSALGVVTLSNSATDGNDSMDGGSDNDLMYGQGGNDTMTGSDGNDSMVGGQGNDSMDGGTGNDIMLGDDGTIVGSVVTLNNSATDGNDTMTGGDGNDTMFGQGGNDYMMGNAGDDSMSGGDGNDSMIGGQGNDSMTGDGGNDIMLGDDGTIVGSVVTLNSSATDGNDTMAGGDGNDIMFGQGGNDYMTGNAGNDSMDGGDGNDSMIGGQGNDSMTGDAGNDIMLGDDGSIAADGTVTLANSATDGSDTMDGGDGNDLMFGQGGNDSMTGDAGSDSMVGGQGNDFMDGGADNDLMIGDDATIGVGNALTPITTATDGNDTMFGGTGDDTMYGEGGDDNMIGGQGNDLMFGGDGQDVMLGDDGTIVPASPAQLQPETSSVLRVAIPASLTVGGNDTMDGGNGNDMMYGQGGNDVMHGGAGDDYMEGNAGNDTMTGDAGDDDMIGGSSVANTPDGADSMDGGDGNDVMLGDNGQITRQVDASNNYVRYNATNKLGLQDGAVIRNVTLFADSDTIGGNDTMTGGTGDDIMYGEAGNDSMAGGDGNDQMYGGLGNDSMDGGAGNDGMVGDKGIINPSIFNGSTQTLLVSQGKKISVLIDVGGTINWSVTLLDPTNGGNDTMIGGLGNDALHGGAGNDLMYGDDPSSNTVGGNDVMFGDLGNDSMYGQAGNDHIYGGSGDDYLDGGLGNDIIYGGDGQDTLIADNANDTLIDWFGNFNSFNVPGPGFGSPTIIRSPDPNMQNFLLTLGGADGATDANGELAVVVPPSPSNSGPGTGGSH